jgi:hypothetical protein
MTISIIDVYNVVVLDVIGQPFVWTQLEMLENGHTITHFSNSASKDRVVLLTEHRLIT